jgi:hypothetical protein
MVSTHPSGVVGSACHEEDPCVAEGSGSSLLQHVFQRSVQPGVPGELGEPGMLGVPGVPGVPDAPEKSQSLVVATQQVLGRENCLLGEGIENKAYGHTALLQSKFKVATKTVRPTTNYHVLVISSRGPKWKNRTQLALDTWVKDTVSMHVTFVGTQREIFSFDKDGSAAERVSFVQPPLGPARCEEGELIQTCCKTIAGLDVALATAPYADWIVRVVDDTYVKEDGLDALLEAHNSLKHTDAYIGQRSLCHNFPSLCPDVTTGKDIPHAGGGAGFIVSRPLAEKIMKDRDYILATCYQDDLWFGTYLKNKLQVQLTHSSVIYQQPHFTEVKLTGACADNNPQDVWETLGDWGTDQPFMYQPWRNLALIHSEPGKAWQQFSSLTRLDAETSQRSHLMVYLETQGRRIIGSHFITESGPLLTLSACSVKEEVA